MAPAAGDNGNLMLDLTGAFTAVDDDGDPVTLNADSIRVVVENDIRHRPVRRRCRSGSMRTTRPARRAIVDRHHRRRRRHGRGDVLVGLLGALVTPGADERSNGFQLERRRSQRHRRQTVGTVNVLSAKARTLCR